MTKSQLPSRKNCCIALFWLKFLVALVIGVGLLAAMAGEISALYRKESAYLKVIPKEGCPSLGDRALLEPPQGFRSLGFHLNWKEQTPTKLSELVGFKPAVFNAFMQLDSSMNPPFNWDMLIWHAQEARKVKAALALTIEPSRNPSEIAVIPQAILDQIADYCKRINTEFGTVIFLRFGHEMNGDWTYYGMQPIEFRLGFQRMAMAIQKKTNMTAMVWGPNVGINYPFTGQADPVLNNTANFRELDTDGDGVLTFNDDPYTPYYPGDKYVDWVALSLYWYPDAGTGWNGLPEPSYFEDSLTGAGPSVLKFNPIVNGMENRNFYENFSKQKRKPFMVAETSAPVIPAILTRTASNLAIKRNWWMQLFSEASIQKFPNFKLAIWFDEIKSDGAEIRDWAITSDPEVIKGFSTDFKAMKKVLFAESIDYECDGLATLKKQ